jgi:hypothetical protein
MKKDGNKILGFFNGAEFLLQLKKFSREYPED